MTESGTESDRTRASKAKEPRNQENSKATLAVAVVAVLVSMVSVGFTGATYFDQSHTNAAQLWTDKASAQASLEHEADRVSYYVGPASGSGKKALVVANRSLGPIRDILLWINALGRLALIPDLPPCSMEFMPLHRHTITAPHLSKSALLFIDGRGNFWRLESTGRLLHISPFAREGSWSYPERLARANDCS